MLNSINLIGRLTADPELKTTPQGVFVLQFTLAVDHDLKDKDGQRGCDFFTCVAWRQTAEFISRYTNKGDTVSVSGRMTSRKFTAKDGTERTVWEVSVNNAYPIGGNRNGSQSTPASSNHTAPAQNQYATYSGADLDDDDVPF